VLVYTVKIQECMYRDTVNVECEMDDHTGNSWSHQNNKRNLEAIPGKHSLNSLQETAIF
jgi:hypothetical protein